MRRYKRWAPLVVAAGALIVGLSLVQGAGQGTLLLPWLCINALLAMSLRLMMLVGEVSLAIGAFYGVGAYTAAQMTVIAETPLIVSVLAGALVAAVGAALIGAITLRVTGAAFILVSFAFTEALRLVYTKSDWLGSNSGIIGIFADPEQILVVMVCSVVAVGLLAVVLERSRLGRQFRSVEDKALLASVSGISPWRTKVIAMTASGVVAGLAGGLFAHYSTVIAPTDFSFMISITALAFVMIGGRHYLLGAVVGALVLTTVSEEIRAFGPYEPLVYGGALILALILLPEGIVGGVVALLDRVRGARSTSSLAKPVDDPQDEDVQVNEMTGSPR